MKYIRFIKKTVSNIINIKGNMHLLRCWKFLNCNPHHLTRKYSLQLLQQAVATKEWMVKGIYESRAKDYPNPFRKMVYDTQKEMEKVIGKLKDNAFIQQQQEELVQFKKQVAAIIKDLGL